MIQKKVVVGVMIFGIMLVSVGLISAGWFSDLFTFGEGDGGEGELDTAHGKNVQLDVAGAPSSPEIVFISDLGYAVDAASVVAGDRILTGDNYATKTFEFYAWSNAGVSALPGPGGDIVTNTNSLMTVKDIINLPNRERDSSETGGVTCVYDRDANAPSGAIAAYVGQQCRVYRCSIGMYYYDDYGGGASPNFRVYAYVEDNWDQSEGYRDDALVNDNSEVLPTRLTYFNRLDESKLVPATGSMDFGTVGYGPQTTQPIDVVDVYPLRIRNTGNSDITPIRVQGEDIPGLITNTEYILAPWFSVSEASSNPCIGTALVDGSLVNSGMSQIDNSLNANGDLRVCLIDVQGSASVQGYSTTEAVNGVSWSVDSTFA